MLPSPRRHSRRSTPIEQQTWRRPGSVAGPQQPIDVLSKVPSVRVHLAPPATHQPPVRRDQEGLREAEGAEDGGGIVVRIMEDREGDAGPVEEVPDRGT